MNHSPVQQGLKEEVVSGETTGDLATSIKEYVQNMQGISI